MQVILGQLPTAKFMKLHNEKCDSYVQLLPAICNDPKAELFQFVPSFISHLPNTRSISFIIYRTQEQFRNSAGEHGKETMTVMKNLVMFLQIFSINPI